MGRRSWWVAVALTATVGCDRPDRCMEDDGRTPRPAETQRPPRRSRRRHEGSVMKRVGARAWLAAAIVLAGLGAAWWAWTMLATDPLGQGHRAYDRGDWRGGAQVARAVLKEKPGDPGALRLLGRSASRQGRHDVAQAIYGRLGEAEMQGEDYLLL